MPYEMNYSDDHGNMCVHLIDHPNVISHFFKVSNLIDVHNQVQQDELTLKKGWISTDGFFHLATTLLWIHVVDCWKLFCVYPCVQGIT